jgi:hypothetical protein
VIDARQSQTAKCENKTSPVNGESTNEHDHECQLPESISCARIHNIDVRIPGISNHRDGIFKNQNQRITPTSPLGDERGNYSKPYINILRDVSISIPLLHKPQQHRLFPLFNSTDNSFRRGRSRCIFVFNVSFQRFAATNQKMDANHSYPMDSKYCTGSNRLLHHAKLNPFSLQIS